MAGAEDDDEELDCCCGLDVVVVLVFSFIQLRPGNLQIRLFDWLQSQISWHMRLAALVLIVPLL